MRSNENSNIPNSNNIVDIVKSIEGFSTGIKGLVPTLTDLVKSISDLSKIKTDKLKDSKKNMRTLTSFIKGFGNCLTDINKAILDGMKDVNQEQLRETLRILNPRETPLNPDKIVSDTAAGKTYGVDKEAGLIATISSIVGLAQGLGSMKPVNPIKFEIAFSSTLKSFKRAYRKIDKFGQGLNPAAVLKMQKVTDALKDIMQELPMSVELMTEMFVKAGNPKTILLAKQGAAALLGRGWSKSKNKQVSKGQLGALLTLSVTINAALANGDISEDNITSFKSYIDKSNKAINILLGMLTLAAVAAIPAYLGALVLFGVKGKWGVIDIVIKGLAAVDKQKKSIQDSAKVILFIAGAVGLIGITALVLALTGLLVIKAGPAIAVVFLFVGAIILMFLVLAKSGKFIEKGSKEWLYIAGTLAILALTAMLLALTGQFIVAEWKSILKVGAMMGWLVLLFVGLGLLSKFINDGIKEFLYIAAALAILALTAVLLVLVSQYLDANWEQLGAISVMMVVLVGAIVVIGLLHKKIEKGVGAVVLIVAFSLAMVVVMGAIAAIAAIADPLEMLAVVGIMTLLIIAVGALAIAAGALLAGPQAIFFALGLVALTTITGVCAAIAGIALLVASVAKTIDSTGYKDPKELAAVLNLPFAALIRGDENGESIFTILKDLPGMVTMAKLVAKIGMLAMIMGETGLIANVLQHIASLNMPDPEAGYDAKGNPLGWKQMQADDFAKASMNTSVILGMTAAMFGDEEKEFTLGDGSRFKVRVVDLESINKIGYMTRIKVKRLAKIVRYVGSMADVLQHIASLNMPDPEKGYNENGKPLGWKQMRGPDFAAAASNAGTILSFFADLFADKPVTRKILGQTVTIGMTNELAGLENISRKMRKRVSRLGEIVGVVGNMATTLQNIASLTIPDEIGEDGKVKTWKKMGDPEFATAASNAQLIITTLLSAVTSDEFAGQLEAMSKKSAKNFKTILEPMGQISGMVDLVKAMSTGEYVKKWGDDPNNPGQRIPIEYGNFIELLDNKGQIQSNITSLFSIIIGSVAQFETDGNYKDMRIGAKKSINDISSIITGIKDPIDTMIEIYNNGLASLDVEQMEKKYNIVSANIKKIIDDVSGATTKKDVAVQIEKNLKQTTALFKSIDKTSVDKLRSASDLMRNIASLARSIHGDFDGLARVINEQLLTALEEFRDELKRINEEGIMVNGRHSDNIGDTLTDNKNPKVTNPDGKVEKGGQQHQQQQIDNKRKSLERAVNDILTLLQNVSDGSTPNSSTTLKIS